MSKKQLQLGFHYDFAFQKTSGMSRFQRNWCDLSNNMLYVIWLDLIRATFIINNKLRPSIHSKYESLVKQMYVCINSEHLCNVGSGTKCQQMLQLKTSCSGNNHSNPSGIKPPWWNLCSALRASSAASCGSKAFWVTLVFYTHTPWTSRLPGTSAADSTGSGFGWLCWWCSSSPGDKCTPCFSGCFSERSPVWEKDGEEKWTPVWVEGCGGLRIIGEISLSGK